MRKVYLLVALITILVSCNSQSENLTNNKKNNSQQKPNVIFILADDLGIYDLSVTGSNYYETPNIDKIANEGTIFTQGYAASRVCSPSRASIMTGQHTARHGITDWIGAAAGEQWRKQGYNNKIKPANYDLALSSDDLTLAEAFEASGYQTLFAGKWHLGTKGSWPTDHGFSKNIGGWDSGSPKGGYFSPWSNPNLANEVPGENLSIRLATETSNFIEENKEKPFFAFLSFYAVHGPIQTSKDKWSKYQQKAKNNGILNSGFEMERRLPIRTVQDNPVYAGLVEQMDDAVGIVLDKLKKLGLEENTIIVFTSDNGGVASGDAFSTSNLPLRGGKGYQWEGGIREPYFIKNPLIANAPKKIDYPVTGADFYPTLLEFISSDQNPTQLMDGKSLVPLFMNKEMEDRPLFWHYPHYGNQGGDPSSIIRLGYYKLIHYWETGEQELYNLSTDVGERNNIASQHPKKVKKLSSLLKNYLKKVNAELPEIDSKFDEDKANTNYKNIKSNLLPRLEKQRLLYLSDDYQPNDTWWDSNLPKD